MNKNVEQLEIDRKLDRPSASNRHHRQRATVLVFVLAILGVLFVTGIAFLTNMNFQAEIARQQNATDNNQFAINEITSFVKDAITENFIAGPGEIGDTEHFSEVLPAGHPDNVNPFRPFSQPPELFDQPTVRVSGPSWADLPGVHGLSAQSEPTSSGGFSYSSDYLRVRSGLFSQDFWNLGNIGVSALDIDQRTSIFHNGGDVFNTMFVDSDGDAINDTRQYIVNPDDIAPDKYARISAAVNDPTNPQGRIYLGLRIIPHGAMANVNESHPTILRAALGYDGEWNAIDNTNEDPSRQGPYVHSIEEPQLRRRWLFPPAEMSISGLHGNPALPNEGLGSGGGDFSNRLFPQQSPYFGNQAETVHDGNHQYWPFDIYNGGVVRFVEQMNPYNVDQYDHRHVVTTASHDDLLSRGSTIDFLQTQSCGSGGGTFRTWERRDVLDLMKERVLTDQCTVDFGFEELNFEYVNYPHTILSATRTADYGEPSSTATDDLTGLFYLGGAVSWCECEDP
ncbi:MAG: hypothetical protein ACYTHJ_20935, partial [Planctomycetota bacterium]